MNTFDIIDNDKFDIDAKQVNTILNEALTTLDLDNIFIQVSFVSDNEMLELNTKYRSINHSTDVLSFPQVELPEAETRILGDIVICMSVVREKGETLEDVLKHGLLHLLGFDHEVDQEKWDAEATKINCKY